MNQAIAPSRNGNLPSRPEAEQAISAYYRPGNQTVAIHRLEEAGLAGYFALVRRRKFALTAAALVGATVGLFVAGFSQPQYQAHASLEVEGLNGDFMNMRKVDPKSLPANYMTSDAYLQTQMKLLSSDTLIDRTVEKMKHNGEFVVEPANWWQRLKNVFGATQGDAAKRTVKRLAETLNVRGAVGQARIIDVRVDSFQPKMAADFVNTLSAEYIRSELEARMDSLKTTRQWLVQQLEELRGNLTASEDRLHAYAQQTGLLFTSQANDLSEDALQELHRDQQLLNNAQTERANSDLHYERARSSPTDSLPEVLADRTVRDARKSLIELNRQLAELTAQDGQTNPKVSVTRAQIASVETILGQQKQAIVEKLDKDREEARRREANFEAAYIAQKRRVREDAEKSIRYQILKREVDTNRQLYEGMLQNVKEAEFAATRDDANVRLVDRAKVPEKPYKPSWSQNTGLGLLAGLLLGLTWAVSREHTDQTLRSPGDAATLLNIPELGVIPTAGGQEAFRSILLSILYSDNRVDVCRTLVICPASPMPENENLTENLSLAFASVGQKVLLTNAARLSGLAANGAKIPDTRLIQERNKNLFVIDSCGASVDSLRHPEGFATLFDSLRDRFDVIMVDTPALSQSSDARVFGRLSDSVILVARAGHTTRDALASTRDRLVGDGVRVLGVVLVDCEPIG